VGKSYKEKRTKLILDDLPVRKPKKPRSNGAGFHDDGSTRRKNTRSAQKYDLHKEKDEDE